VAHSLGLRDPIPWTLSFFALSFLPRINDFCSGCRSPAEIEAGSDVHANTATMACQCRFRFLQAILVLLCSLEVLHQQAQRKPALPFFSACPAKTPRAGYQPPHTLFLEGQSCPGRDQVCFLLDPGVQTETRFNHVDLRPLDYVCGFSFARKPSNRGSSCGLRCARIASILRSRMHRVSPLAMDADLKELFAPCAKCFRVQ